MGLAAATANLEWGECLVPAVPVPSALQAEVRKAVGAVPGWLARLAPGGWWWGARGGRRRGRGWGRGARPRRGRAGAGAGGARGGGGGRGAGRRGRAGRWRAPGGRPRRSGLRGEPLR